MSDTESDSPKKRNASSQDAASAPQPRAVKSEDLLQGSRELFILHHGETYRLMETRNGKLILQK